MRISEDVRFSELVLISLNVVTDQDERQFTYADIDILVPNVKGLLVEISYVIKFVERAEPVRSIKSSRLIQVVFVVTEPGNVEITRAKVNIVNAYSETGGIQPEIIL